MEVGQADAAGGQSVEHRGLDVGAVAAELGEANVVEHDEHHVGRPGRGRRLGGPPGLGVPPVTTDPPAELHLRVGCHALRFAQAR